MFKSPLIATTHPISGIKIVNISFFIEFIGDIVITKKFKLLVSQCKLGFANIPVKISGQALPLQEEGRYRVALSPSRVSLCGCILILLEFIINVVSRGLEPNQNQLNVMFLVTQYEMGTYRTVLCFWKLRNYFFPLLFKILLSSNFYYCHHWVYYLLSTYKKV